MACDKCGNTHQSGECPFVDDDTERIIADKLMRVRNAPFLKRMVKTGFHTSQLRRIATELNIVGRSNMNVADLKESICGLIDDGDVDIEMVTRIIEDQLDE